MEDGHWTGKSSKSGGDHPGPLTPEHGLREASQTQIREGAPEGLLSQISTSSTGNPNRQHQAQPPACLLGTELAYQLGIAFAMLSPSRIALIGEAWRALYWLTERCEWVLIHELVGSLAFWVVDLPASQRHHHRHPYGLLDHSLEVGVETVLDLYRRWRSVGDSGILKAQERALWSRVAFALGLFHDIGKVHDVSVQVRDGGHEWDPLKEPLGIFKRRHGLNLLGPSGYHHRKGRRVHGHDAWSLEVASAVFSGGQRRTLWPFLRTALVVYREAWPGPSRPFPIPFEYLENRVRAADRASAGRDCATIQSDPPEFLEGFSQDGRVWHE